MTAEFLVMNLQLLHAATTLASPIFSLEHVSAEFLICERPQLQPRAFRADIAFTHFALGRREKPASDRPAES